MIPGTGSVPRESVERLAHRRSEAALSEQDLVAERDSGRGGCTPGQCDRIPPQAMRDHQTPG